MDTVATSLADEEEWELYNDDGFVYKRKKRRLNPDEAALAAAARPLSMDPEAEERNRRERKRKTLLKLKERYQREIDRWELLANTLRAMEERARQRQEHEDTPSLSALPLSSPEIVNGSLVDELLLQVKLVFVCLVGKCGKTKEIEFLGLWVFFRRDRKVHSNWAEIDVAFEKLNQVENMIRKVPFSFLLFFSFASVSEQPNTSFRVLTASFCSFLLILVEEWRVHAKDYSFIVRALTNTIIRAYFLS